MPLREGGSWTHLLAAEKPEPQRICEHYVTHLLLPTEELKEHHIFSSCKHPTWVRKTPRGREGRKEKVGEEENSN